ncbi:Crp/Fnr family transcriptional regulator [Methylobacterium oxalidis]|uniref:Crp/Fnr family transcriptional regulator n=1 Tax=Methylobacterium oxalidis TaxID=944322 RepID=UPI0014788639|nr:Crp/Fnr family transcriptional regulator [Methylobacterium oxalidis]
MLLSLVGTPLDVAARQAIIGQHAERICLVMSGLACRYATLPDGTRRIAAFIIPGDLVGSPAGFTSGLPWRVGTLIRCSVAGLSRPDLCTLSRTYPGIRRALQWLMQDELNRARAWLLNDSQPSLQRVAYLLCELQARLEAAGLAGQGACELSLSQADLADAAATSHVHVSRVLQTLFSERLVSLGHQKLTITDVPRLRDLAGFDPGHLAAGVAELEANDLLGSG